MGGPYCGGRIILYLILHGNVGHIPNVVRNRDASGIDAFPNYWSHDSRFQVSKFIMDTVLNQTDGPNTAQVQDIMNPATFVPPESQPTPRVTIEFCDRVCENLSINPHY